MKKNIPINKAISLSMMITLGMMMANGALADAQNKKESSRRERDNHCDRSPRQNLAVVK